MTRPTETQCQDTIVEAAILNGWRVHHQRPAQTSKGWKSAIKGHAGWPDLVLARGTTVMFIELKRHPNTCSPDQLAWQGHLRAGGLDARVVWVPEQMDELIRELSRPMKGRLR